MCVIVHLGGEKVDNLNVIIASNLKKIREERKLSLDKVAELTGVSKSMIGQIERSESNPTITTVWKLATGLKISFSSLMSVPQPQTAVIKKEDIEPFVEYNGRYRVYPFFPYEDSKKFEMFTVEIDKGGYWNAEAHGDNTSEFISVFEGELTVRTDNFEYSVTEGNSIRFRADKPHAYHNSGKGMVKLSMVIYYPE